MGLLGYVWVCVGMHRSAHVCGINFVEFLPETRVLTSADFNMHSNEPISHFKFKFFSLCHILLNLSHKELNISYRCKKSNLEKSFRMSTKLRMF